MAATTIHFIPVTGWYLTQPLMDDVYAQEGIGFPVIIVSIACIPIHRYISPPGKHHRNDKKIPKDTKNNLKSIHFLCFVDVQ